jgi:hypothetical protein
MGAYDKASRRATQEEPLAVCARLGELAKLRWRFADWTQTQTAPKVEGRDQTADRLAILEDLDAPGRLWLGVMEFQSQHEADKLDDLFAESAQFRRTLRHGEQRDRKYAVMPVLVYLVGKCPKEGAALDMRSPGGHGLLHAPVVWEVGEDSAVEALDAYEQGKTTWGILFWVPLMRGADDATLAERWRDLVLKLPAANQAMLPPIAFVFAGLAGRGQVWRRVLEEWNMTESPIVNEWMEQSRLLEAREMLLLFLRSRFPNAVPEDVIELIKSQPSHAILRDWGKQAGTLSIDQFRDYVRR